MVLLSRLEDSRIASLSMDLSNVLLSVAVVALAFIGANIYTRFSAISWMNAPYPPGRMVRAANTRLYTRVKGEGSPVIVIEPGLGSPGAEWWLIQDELARMTTVVTYDRAGYGWSRPGKFPRTGFQIVDELSSMLYKAGIEGPLILVGHSQGGLYAQLFGRLHPDRVAGAVFLDPVSSNNSRFKAELKPSVYRDSRIDVLPYARMPAALRMLGLMRICRNLIESRLLSYQAALPATIREVIWQHLTLPKAYRAVANEHEQNDTPANSSEVRNAGAFPPVPLKVIYHSPRRMVHTLTQFRGLQKEDAEEVEQIWQQLARAYIRLSPQSEWIVARESGHYIHIDEPELVIEEIRQLVLRVRGASPVS